MPPEAKLAYEFTVKAENVHQELLLFYLIDTRNFFLFLRNNAGSSHRFILLEAFIHSFFGHFQGLIRQIKF